MGSAEGDPPDDLRDAIGHLQHLKAEHRDLLDTIARDPGMTPETRRALVEHVLTEEDESLASIASLSGQGPAPAAPPEPSGASEPGRRARLSVGSLRRDAGTSSPAPTSGTVGTLRKD